MKNNDEVPRNAERKNEMEEVRWVEDSVLCCCHERGPAQIVGIPERKLMNDGGDVNSYETRWHVVCRQIPLYEDRSEVEDGEKIEKCNCR